MRGKNPGLIDSATQPQLAFHKCQKDPYGKCIHVRYVRYEDIRDSPHRHGSLHRPHDSQVNWHEYIEDAYPLHYRIQANIQVVEYKLKVCSAYSMTDFDPDYYIVYWKPGRPSKITDVPMRALEFWLQKCIVVPARSNNRRIWQAIDTYMPGIYRGKSSCRKTADVNIPPTAPNDSTRADITAFLLWDTTLFEDFIWKFVHYQSLARWTFETHVGQDAGDTHCGTRSAKKESWGGVIQFILASSVLRNTHPHTSNWVVWWSQ